MMCASTTHHSATAQCDHMRHGRDSEEVQRKAEGLTHPRMYVEARRTCVCAHCHATVVISFRRPCRRSASNESRREYMPMARWAVLGRDGIIVEVSTSTNVGETSTVNSQRRLRITDLGLTSRSTNESWTSLVTTS